MGVKLNFCLNGWLFFVRTYPPTSRFETLQVALDCSDLTCEPPSRDPVSGTKRSAGLSVQAKADAIVLLGFGRIVIKRDNLCRCAARADAAAVHPDDPVTQGLDLLHIMRNHYQGAAAPERFHEGEAFPSESGVADSQRLIDDQDVGFGVNADREGQPRAHAGGIEPHRLIEKRTDRGKLGDRWYAPEYIRPAQSKDRAANQHILAARHLQIEGGAQGQDRGDPSRHADFPTGGLCNTAKQPEQSCLARAVPPDDPNRFASLHL